MRMPHQRVQIPDGASAGELDAARLTPVRLALLAVHAPIGCEGQVAVPQVVMFGDDGVE